MDLNHDWIRNLWINWLGPRTGHVLHVLAALRGYTDVRDSQAHLRVRNCTSERTDVHYHYAPANRVVGTPIPPQAGDLFLFVGRARAMLLSPWGGIARQVELCQVGKFIDTVQSRPHSIAYEGRPYTRREEFVVDHSRCFLDYAVLSLHTTQVGGIPIVVASIAGLGSLGTLGLAVLLERADLRNELATQAWSILPNVRGLDPSRRAEILVRIELNEGEELDSVLNVLERRDGPLPFLFRVEVVAIAKRGTDEVHIAVADDIPPLLELEIDDDTCVVRIIATQQELPLTPGNLELLWSLAARPNETSTANLCALLRPADSGVPGISVGAVRARKLALRDQLVKSLGAQGKGIVTFHFKEQRYRLRGVCVRTRSSGGRGLSETPAALSPRAVG